MQDDVLWAFSERRGGQEAFLFSMTTDKAPLETWEKDNLNFPLPSSCSSLPFPVRSPSSSPYLLLFFFFFFFIRSRSTPILLVPHETLLHRPTTNDTV